MRTLLLFLSLFTLITFSYSQQSEPCGQAAYLDYLESLQSGFKQHADDVYFEAIKQAQLKNKFEVKDTVHTIKVVFHVVYNSQIDNIPDEYIHSQLKVLNACFRRQNPDTTDTREIFRSVAGDAGIEFVLATEDPNGNATSGITRTYTSKSSFLNSSIDLGEADAVKGSTFGHPAWNTEEYLNIWVCDLSVQNLDALLGYAYPPTNAPFWNSSSYAGYDRQGVVVHYKVVGESNPFKLSTGVKTLVHEVGHYLGLRHIWGDAPSWGRCNANYDDFIDDTPLAGTNSNASGCNYNKNTCNFGTPGDLPDMIENYMDYSPEVCQNMFTNGQIDVMRSNLVKYRSGIYSTKFPLKLWPDYTESGIYPNPAYGQLNVSLIGFTETEAYSLKLINMLGQEVFSQSLENTEAQSVNIDFGFKGVYIYQLLADDKIVTEGKLLIMN
ncbi:MAG: hypothetical protein RLZZ337_647 [Bacteroidota bacterium]